MLVPAVKQRASNNLIMRLEMPGRGGRCRPSAAHAPPAACGARELSGCLLPLTLLLISSPSCCRAGRWGRARGRLPPPCRSCWGHRRLHRSQTRSLRLHCREEMLCPGLGVGMAGPRRVSQGEDGWLCSPAAWPR